MTVRRARAAIGRLPEIATATPVIVRDVSTARIVPPVIVRTVDRVRIFVRAMMGTVRSVRSSRAATVRISTATTVRRAVIGATRSQAPRLDVLPTEEI